MQKRISSKVYQAANKESEPVKSCFFFKTESGLTKSENVSIYSGIGKLVVWVGGLDS